MSNTFPPRTHGFSHQNQAQLNKRKPQPVPQLSPQLATLLAKLAQAQPPTRS